MKPRASRIALIVASVPELTSRTCSSDGTQLAQQLGHLDLGFGGRAEAQALRRGLLHRLDHLGMRVAERSAAPTSRRSRCSSLPSASQTAAPSPRCEEERRAADRAKRAHRRIDAAGDHALRALEQLVAALSCGARRRTSARMRAPRLRRRGASNSAEITATASAPAAIELARIVERDAADRDHRHARARAAPARSSVERRAHRARFDARRKEAAERDVVGAVALRPRARARARRSTRRR